MDQVCSQGQVLEGDRLSVSTVWRLLESVGAEFKIRGAKGVLEGVNRVHDIQGGH